MNKGTRRQLKYPSHYQYSSITSAPGPRQFFHVQRYPKQALGVTSDIFILSLKWTLVLLQLDPLTSSSALGGREFWKKIKRRVFLQAFKSIFPHGNCSSRTNSIQHRKLTRWAPEILFQSLSSNFLNMKKKKIFLDPTAHHHSKYQLKFHWWILYFKTYSILKAFCSSATPSRFCCEFDKWNTHKISEETDYGYV